LKVLLACCVAICLGQQGNVTILGDMTVTGAFRTTAIRSEQLTVDGSMSVTHGVSGESLLTKRASISVLETVAISSPTGTVHVSGELSLGELSANGTVRASSFIQEDVHQWALTFHDDFEQDAAGWNMKLVNTCDGNDHHLAGHCNTVEDEIKKTFTGLKPHKYLRLQARYHFLDSWEGETAYAKLGDRTVWTDVNDARDMHPNALSLCGGDHPDTRLSVPIDVTIPHTDSSVTVAFGSTLDEHACNESFGIDDVMISIRG